MESRINIADEKHLHGYNCAQAVGCAYCDLVGMDEETMFRIGEGLGGGMGCAEGTCGALSAACVLVGLLEAKGEPGHSETRRVTAADSKAIVERFRQSAGATRCADIKGKYTGIVLRSCRDCVKDAAAAIEEVLMKDR